MPTPALPFRLHADQPALFALEVAAFALAAFALFCLLVVYSLAWSYARLRRERAKDIDTYVGQPSPPVLSRAKVAFLHRMNVGGHRPAAEPVALGERPSAHVPGLKVTCALSAEGCTPCAATPTSAVVLGTIRMGFGHLRIAHAAASWVQRGPRAAYFHDLLAIDSAEAELIKAADRAYSRGSRLASELGGPVERFWGALTRNGDEDALRATWQMGEHLKALLAGLDKGTPIIATHCLVGMAAVAAGFTRVINLVIDNHAQWFVIVPGALNLVQGPSNLHALLRMGVPASEVRLAGHWIPRELVQNAAVDSAARASRSRAGRPLRFLVPVGGAGAQRRFIVDFVTALGPLVRAGRAQLFLNAGDHPHMLKAFETVARKLGGEAPSAAGGDGRAYDLVDSLDGVRRLCERLEAGGSPPCPVTVFAFAEAFPAVAATDLLCRGSDVLCCKPSELAFYPIPKLMLRRVGDHELHSAVRASELGDGTHEARTVEAALRYAELFAEPGSPLLAAMAAAVARNAREGVYDGCKVAAALAAA